MPLPASAAAPDPVAFFRGHTHGRGSLKVLFQSPRALSVDSRGNLSKNGTLVVRQAIRQGAKPVRIRIWRLRALGPGRFAGSLTDAQGPVAIEQHGNALHIRYTGKDRFDVDQWLAPQGRKALRNRMTVSRFGITVARVDELIRKLD
ncbi:MAG: DUF3833 family protein [Sphingomicrobium sp.]